MLLLVAAGLIILAGLFAMSDAALLAKQGITRVK